jgi:hypothetical protein
MATRRAHRLLLAACVGSLVALVLMTWELFDPRVFPIMIAMSVGQIVGTASFATFGIVVVMDLRARRRAAREERRFSAE